MWFYRFSIYFISKRPKLLTSSKIGITLRFLVWKSQQQLLSVLNNSDVKTWQLPLKDETISIEIAHKQAEEKKDTIEHPKCKTCFSTGDTQLLVTLKAHRIFHRMSGHVCSIFPKKNYFFDKDPLEPSRRYLTSFTNCIF